MASKTINPTRMELTRLKKPPYHRRHAATSC